ncbi:MAG: hypothetical protein KDC98_20850, partial [Planctomycetes bacterium]|nr:hypothetical protein [Planctomycetota bacterium]
ETLTSVAGQQAMIAALADEVGAEAEAELERSAEEIAEYERQLVLLDEGTATIAEQRSIEKLIAQLKSDRAIVELVIGLGSGLSALGSAGIEIAGAATEQVGEVLVGEIAGPLKAAKLILKMSAKLVKAAEHWRLWQKFRKSMQLAKKAQSSLSSTLQGFADNQGEHLTMDAIETALLTVQLAGAVIGSVPEPVTMAVGKTLSAVGTAGSAAATFANQVYNEKKLRDAWQITKDAMNNPRDRSLGLAALRLNPTLAMHALAWAAVDRADPIARAALHAAGLNEQTLAHDGSTEKKVREYLETLLNDDRKLLDFEQIDTRWQPKPIELTTRCWILTVSRAQRNATPKLGKHGTDAVLAAVKAVDVQDMGVLGAAAALGTMDAAAVTRHRRELSDLARALGSYQPRTEDGSAHVEMASIVDQFIALVGTRNRMLDRLQAENDKAIADALASAAARQRVEANQQGAGIQ